MPKQLSPIKRIQIIEAAESLIAELGFRGLSMHKVAKRAGISAGTIYHYFTDKEHLIHQVRQHVAQRIANEVQHNIDDTMSVKQRHQVICLNIWNLSESNQSVISNRVQYESLPTDDRRDIQIREQKLFHQVHQMLNQGKQQNILKPLANEILICLGFEPLLSIVRKKNWGIIPHQPDGIDAIIEASWDAIIQH